MMFKNVKLGWIAGIFIMVFLMGAPYWVNQGLLFLLGLALIEALFALSWNLMFSYAGLASFGHAAFYGIGAYTVAAFLFHGIKIPFLLVLVIAVAVGAASSFLVAIVVLRRASGIQLAVLTLALSQLLVLGIGYTTFLGRDDGLSGLRPPKMDFGLFNVDMASRVSAYYFILVVCAAAGGGLWWLASGRRGRALQAVRIDPQRAAFVGIDVWRQRVFAFTVAGACAALAGGLAAPWAQIVAPDSVQWLHSAQPMLATLLGGAGFFWGPVLGVFGLMAINYATRTYVGLLEIMVGSVLLVIVMVAPSGLLGFAARFREILRRKEPCAPPSRKERK
jgi:branched-chain amino acid transport system permease protein